MAICVLNCFDWLGYHIVNRLLESGKEVWGQGLAEEPHQEHLSLFFGRNSSFKLLDETAAPETAELVIQAGACEASCIKSVKHLVVIGDAAPAAAYEKKTRLDAELLIGFWMPMTEKAVSWNGQLVDFSSDFFLQEAVWIDDFCEVLLQILDIEYAPETTVIASRESEKSTCRKMIQLIARRSSKELQDKLLNHYRRFSLAYPHPD